MIVIVYDAEKSEPVVFSRVLRAEFEVRNEGQRQNIVAIFQIIFVPF